MKSFYSALVIGLAVALAGAEPRAAAADLSSSLDTIRNVGPEAASHRKVIQALKDVTQADADSLPQILTAFDEANPLAANWLSAAVESIADRELEKSGKLPTKELEAFLADRKHDSRARRLAFELIAKVDSVAAELLVPGFADDPCSELRREAVTRLIQQANKHYDAKDPKSTERYRKALAAALDPDQINVIAEKLKAVGQQVDLPRHFGFLMNWKLIGPFDNTDRKGFDVAYPPELEFDPKATYQGKTGPVKWTDYATEQEYGIVDLNKAQSHHKGSLTYAATEFDSDADRKVELRLGTVNAYKVWVNGKLVFARDEYHRGMRMDQYKLAASLEKGRNLILVKLCQNEQTEDWAQRWEFQLRVCDASGAAILSTSRPPTPKSQPTSATGE